ncbi:MAG: hypothetical protein GY856_04105 [bacterium]|nr:hypothetical protein [bacterium]
MKFVFTDYVRALEPGEEPEPERFETLWERLRAALVGELHKRSLWSAPASYLGAYGWTSWSQEEALEELLIDCYSFIFIERLEALKALLEMQENVEGLVFRNIRNFLYNIQKKHDPLGFRVFVALQSATRQAIVAQTLYVVAGDPRIRNDTLLGFVPRHDPGEAQSPDLSDHVRSWSDDLLPELVTARGAALEEVTKRLALHLAQLADQGVELFRFKDVIDPLKWDVRTRWSVIWQQAEGETTIADGDEEFVELVRLVRPDSGFEERQSFEQLLACVAAALARIEVTEKARAYLHTLWGFVRAHVVEDHGDKLPARQKIAELLGIPRYRLPELFEILGRELQRCRGDGPADKRPEPAPEEAKS